MKKIMRKNEVLEATGLCYTSIFNKMKRGEFPASRKLGKRAVCWMRQEVEDWLNALPVNPEALPVNPGIERETAVDPLNFDIPVDPLNFNVTQMTA